MESSVPLQEIIGVDKKNPYFTVCKSAQHPGKLQVFLGAVLLEIVENNREHPNFKLLLARLYNGGVKPKSITEAFSVPYTTLRRWAEALKSGDTDQLIRVLAGRQHPRKLTPEILSFAEKRFHNIYPENHAYSKAVREDILDVFDLQVSAESLRPYFSQWKPKSSTSSTLKNESDCSCLDDEQPISSGQAINHPPSLGSEEQMQEKKDHLVGQVSAQTLSEQGAEQDIRKQAVENDYHPVSAITVQAEQDFRFCHHAGILLFSAFLSRLGAALGDSADLIKQWIVTVLLGAANIEQSKLLNGQDLRMLLGQASVNLSHQREALGECAERLFERNFTDQW